MRCSRPPNARPGAHTVKNIFVNLLVFFSSTLFSVLILDFLLKLILPIYDPRGMFNSEYYPREGVRLCPKNFTGRQWKNTGDYNVAVSINKYGFRDRKDFLLAKPGDFFVLGDSFGFAFGVEDEEGFAQLLGKITGIDVYNISVPGTCVGDHQKLLGYVRTRGAKIRNLILSICMENDIGVYDPFDYKYALKTGNIHNHRYHGLQMAGRRIAAVMRQSADRARIWASRNTAVYHALAALIHQNRFLCNIAVRVGLIVSNYDGMYKNEYSDISLNSTAQAIIN
jgi:hypothetical protein